MTEFSTDNGIICRNCFKTVNVSKLPRSSFKSAYLPLGAKTTFKMVCPHCGKAETYPYYHLQPMTAWMTSYAELETKLRIAEAERDTAIANAKMLAGALHQTLPEDSGSPTDPSSLPTNSAMKPPTPPEQPSPSKHEPAYLA